MDKRYFLQISAAFVGTALLSRYINWSSKTMTTSNSGFEVTKTAEEWSKVLTPEQFNVLRKHGTERPHTSALDKEYDKGTYYCAACELPLFTSDTKFNSGTGWPAFLTRLKVRSLLL